MQAQENAFCRQAVEGIGDIIRVLLLLIEAACLSSFDVCLASLAINFTKVHSDQQDLDADISRYIVTDV